MTTISPTSEVDPSHAHAEYEDGIGVSKSLEQLMKFTGLTREVQREGPVRPLQSHLHGLTQAEIALAVVDLLNIHYQHREVLGVVVSHIWNDYVLPQKLWEHYEGGKHKFMEAVSYDEFVAPTLESTSETQKRKCRANSYLEAVWGEGWEKKIDAESDHSSVLSEHYLRLMVKLANRGITLLDAQEVLNHAMRARIARPHRGVRTACSIMVSDIQKVLIAVESVASSPDPEYSATRLISILDPTATEIAAGPLPQPKVSFAPFDRFTPPSCLPSPQPTPSSLSFRAQSNNNELFQTTHHIHSPIQSPVRSRETQPDARSPTPSTRRSTQPLQSLSDPSPAPETSNVHNNEPDVDPKELQSLATGHTVLEPPVSSSLSPSPSLSRKETQWASAAQKQYRKKKKKSAPKRHSTSKRRSTPKQRASKISTPALDSRLQSLPPSPSPAAITQSQPASKKRPYSEYASGDNTIPRRDPTPPLVSRQQNLTHSAPPPVIPQPPAQPQKLPYTQGTNTLPLSPIFSLPDNWADDSGIRASLLERGYYNCPDVCQLADPACNVAIHTQLNLFNHMAKLSDSTDPTYGFHTLLQQALVQHPRVYLTALASMKTTNYRLISLPVPLIDYPDGYQIRDSTFPFDKYIASEKEVPGTRLLFPLNALIFCIGTQALSTQERVKAWWTLSGGDLRIAASQIDKEDVWNLSFQAGELIAMPPQLLWSAEADGPQDDSSQDGRSCTSPVPSKIAEVRYISLAPDQMLEFDYWPTGSYDQLSRWNRDLLTPTVTGWGGETSHSEKRPTAAIEMRGIWAIGDALLGLTSWDSPVVQVQLRELFDAPAGSWFNNKFVSRIEDRFERRLARMVKTLEKVNKLAFNTAE